MKSFRNVKKIFKSTFQEILLEGGDSWEIGEAAIPAYAHKNILIDWLFWERIKICLRFAMEHEKAKKVIDFGCGSGVLSYLLADLGYDVISCDTEFSPLLTVKTKIDFPQNIDFFEGELYDKYIEKNSIDIICALDVLEHIDNLEPYLNHFIQLLAPSGILIVSGPTENRLYQLGRTIAGNRFTGDYHVSNIGEIKKQFGKSFEVKNAQKLIFPIPLFEIFTASLKS